MKRWLILLLVILVGLWWGAVRAIEPIDDLQRQIDELSQALEQSVAATKPLEGELTRLNKQLDNIEAGIAKAKEDLRALEASIAVREKDFGEQYVLLSERVQSLYKNSRAPGGLVVLFTSAWGSNFFRDLFYEQTVEERDKDEIAKISLDLIQLEKDKQKAESDRTRLADLQVKVDKEAEFFRTEVAGAKAYQASLSQQIATLTARQQSIISQRQSSLGLPQSLGAGPLYCTDDRTLDPGFGNALAFYTYGIPHRVGMNQYGAYGRANAGQSADDILRAYFSGINFEGGKQDVQIKIQGNGAQSLDEYLLGIYE